MFTTHHRLPRAGIDHIADAHTALALIAAVTHQPPRSETVALLLDGDRCGRAIAVISGTHDADAVIEVVECLSHNVEELGALVIATVRPPDRGHRHTEAGVDAAAGSLARSLPEASTASPFDNPGDRVAPGRPAPSPERPRALVVRGPSDPRRPRRPRSARDRADPDRSDIDRWLEMSELADQCGVELIEWFVIDDQVVCPRDALGERPRW